MQVLTATARKRVRHPDVLRELDWKSYWERFRAAHGIWSVTYQGKQLFADGWQYGMNEDYSGPEYPPPSDPTEVRRLALCYWKMRKFYVKKNIEFVEQQLQQVAPVCANRSMALIYKSEEG